MVKPTLHLLQARLIASRARVLWLLVGAPEEALGSLPVTGEWTPLALLAHLGDYDRLYAQAVRLARAGRLAAEGLDYGPVDNSRLLQRIGGWGLDEVLEYLTAARLEFLEAIAGMEESELARRHRFPRNLGRSQGSIQSWIQGRANHDAGHLKDLQRWRRRLGRPTLAGPKGLLLAALGAAHADFLSSLELIPAGERAERPITGDWTARDVLGHLADWDGYLLNDVRLALGEAVEPLDWYLDEGSTNARLAAKRQGQPWERVWGDWEAARQTLFARLQSLSAVELGRTVALPPPPFRSGWSSMEHYMEHAAAIRAGLPAAMPAWLLHFQGHPT
jgi:hypothetical protein